MPGDIFHKRTRLAKRERSYCSCLLKVREKSKVNPYGICTNSIYVQQGQRRPIVDCSINYKLENVPTEQLKLLAKERKVSVYSVNKKTKKRSLSKKHILIRRVQDDIITKKAKRNKLKLEKSKLKRSELKRSRSKREKSKSKKNLI